MLEGVEMGRSILVSWHWSIIYRCPAYRLSSKNRDKIMNEVEEGHCLGERRTYLRRYHKGDEKGKEAIRTLKKMITEGETKKQKKTH